MEREYSIQHYNKGQWAIRGYARVTLVDAVTMMGKAMATYGVGDYRIAHMANDIDVVIDVEGRRNG